MLRTKKVGNFFYDPNTSDEVCNIIQKVYILGTRVKIYHGDIETGLAWEEEFETMGTIGSSTGCMKIPLLIPSKRSHGGPALSTNSIVAIRDIKNRKMLYKHPTFSIPEVIIKEGSIHEGYEFSTFINNKLHGAHKTMRQAMLCKTKIEGNLGIHEYLYYNKETKELVS